MQPKLLLIQCEVCGVPVRSDRLARHMEKWHGSISGLHPVSTQPTHPLVQCEVCDVLVRDDQLARHMGKWHANISDLDLVSAPPKRPLVQCKVCGALVSDDRLARHMTEWHAGTQAERHLIQCEVCGVPVRRDKLAKHRNKAHRIKAKSNFTGQLGKEITTPYLGVTVKITKSGVSKRKMRYRMTKMRETRDPRDHNKSMARCAHGVLVTSKCAICNPESFREETGID